jgi:hypothetical protein
VEKDGGKNIVEEGTFFVVIKAMPPSFWKGDC